MSENMRQMTPDELEAAGLPRDFHRAPAKKLPEPWTPTVSEGEELTLATIVGQACGTASMCWDETPTGVFDSTRAKWVVEGALEAIEELRSRPLSADEMDALPAGSSVMLTSPSGDACPAQRHADGFWQVPFLGMPYTTERLLSHGTTATLLHAAPEDPADG